jgi:hypothetical protein
VGRVEAFRDGEVGVVEPLDLQPAGEGCQLDRGHAEVDIRTEAASLLLLLELASHRGVSLIDALLCLVAGEATGPSLVTLHRKIPVQGHKIWLGALPCEGGVSGAQAGRPCSCPEFDQHAVLVPDNRDTFWVSK